MPRSDHRSVKLRHLIARRHHEGGFAGLIHAAKPTCVERRTAFLLFLEGIFPDLHRLAAAWARITITRDDDAQLSNPLPLQIVPRPIEKHERPLDASVRSSEPRNGNLEFRRQVAVDFETDADFNQNRRCPGYTVPF